MKCTEACVSHDCENFWNEETDLENTKLDENDYDLEERTPYILLSITHCVSITIISLFPQPDY